MSKGYTDVETRYYELDLKRQRIKGAIADIDVHLRDYSDSEMIDQFKALRCEHMVDLSEVETEMDTLRVQFKKDVKARGGRLPEDHDRDP